MRKIKAAELVLDYDLYPRTSLDAQNVRNIADAYASGAELPPIIIDRKSKRVTDGFHRVKAKLRVDGPDAEIDVIEKTYKDDAAMFLDAMRYNAGHGAKLDSCDRAHCVIIAARLSIPDKAVAGVLHMPLGKVGDLRIDRTATNAAGLTIPIKRTIGKQFHGRQLNERQVQANDRLSGMSQVFYVNQLIELFEAELLDTDDEQLMERLRHLHGLMETLLVVE